MKARVPASVANMGPGFDVHCVALELPRIEIEFAKAPHDFRRIVTMGKYGRGLTNDPNLNASGRALEALREQFGKPDGYILKIKVDIPPRKGLGLSGAEAVGAVLCANSAFHLGLTRKAIAQISAKAEPSQHMDNVAAAALGGFNIVTPTPTNGQPLITTLRPPRDLGVAVLVPDIEKTSTEAVREFLPETISREKYVESIGCVSRISAGFATGDISAILETLPSDPIIEPHRADAGLYGKGIDSKLLLEEKQRLLKEYHVAETISGAGPSRVLWYSFSEDLMKLKKDRKGLIKPALELVTNRLESCGHKVLQVFLTKPSTKGAEMIRAK